MLDAMYHMETIRADVFGFAETKLDCRHSKVKSLIQRNKNKVWSHCRISTGSSDLPWHALTKPGGVMLGITGPLVGRLRKTVDDALGRWTGMELLGRDGRKLVIICAYQVSQRGGRPGDFTAYSQQVSILRRRGHHNTNPRQHFITDLIACLAVYKRERADIIVMGDFNESIGSTSNGMTQVVHECSLTDVQAYIHGLECEQATYARGPNRVDYFLISERLLPHVK